MSCWRIGKCCSWCANCYCIQQHFLRTAPKYVGETQKAWGKSLGFSILHYPRPLTCVPFWGAILPVLEVILAPQSFPCKKTICSSLSLHSLSPQHSQRECLFKMPLTLVLSFLNFSKGWRVCQWFCFPSMSQTCLPDFSRGDVRFSNF